MKGINIVSFNIPFVIGINPVPQLKVKTSDSKSIGIFEKVGQYVSLGYSIKIENVNKDIDKSPIYDVYFTSLFTFK